MGDATISCARDALWRVWAAPGAASGPLRGLAATPSASRRAILLYLAEGTPLLPADKLGRARAAQWLFFEQNLLEPNIGTGRFWILTGRAEGHDELVRRWQKVGRHSLDVLERRLAGHDFLLDTGYSVADIGLYAYTHLAGDLGIELADYRGVET